MSKDDWDYALDFADNVLNNRYFMSPYSKETLSNVIFELMILLAQEYGLNVKNDENLEDLTFTFFRSCDSKRIKFLFYGLIKDKYAEDGKFKFSKTIDSTASAGE